MTERRYDQDEVAAIFERASETERSLPGATEGGLTLAAVQDIAREVGISPRSIELAARSLDQVPNKTSAKLFGLPLTVGRTVELDGTLSDPDWERLVADLRTTFNATGRLRYDGPFRQWSNGNLKATIEPTPAGHRFRLQTTNGTARNLVTGGLIVLGGATATLIATAATTGINTGALSGIELMGMIGLGMFAVGALRVSGWARRRATQMEEVIARLAKSRSKSDSGRPNAARIPDLT